MSDPEQILGFVGITDISVVNADSMAGSAGARQESLERALVQAEALASVSALTNWVRPTSNQDSRRN